MNKGSATKTIYLVIESSIESSDGYDDLRRHVCLATLSLEVAEYFKESFEKRRDEYNEKWAHHLTLEPTYLEGRDVWRRWDGNAPNQPFNKYVVISGDSTFDIEEIPYLEGIPDASHS